MAGLFTKAMKGKRPASKLDSVTLRGFGGGWNTMDNDLSMAPKYLADLTNFYRTSASSQLLRFGTQFKCDISSVRNSDIVDGVYFNGKNLVVTESGNVLTFDGDGSNVTEIWNTAIAAALPGAPGTWSAGLTQVTFVPFKTSIMIHNGVDKPIEVQSSFAVRYVQDLATGSNVNVPIGKYGCVSANYHCVAGIPASPTEIIISSQGTSGTFIGDPDPNDSISIDVGAYAPEGAASIRGIAGFRTFLIVFLQNVFIQIKLGGYDDAGAHVPEFPDTFPQFGLLGSRCIIGVENDLLFGGLNGLSSARRNVYAPERVDADYLSSIVASSYRRIVGGLTDTQQLRDTFMVYDKLANNLTVIVPDQDTIVYTFNERLGIKAWTKFANLNFRCGWSSILSRVFFADGTRVFQGGNETYTDEAYRADRLLDRDFTWEDNHAYALGDKVYDAATEEVYTANVGLTTGLVSFAQDRIDGPERWTLYEGEAISFTFELPWIDGQDPMKVKHNRYVSIGTKGSATFTLEAYVDNLYKDEDGVVQYSPALSMEFVGNDAAGFGYDDGPFGGGRRSRDARLWGYPVKFKVIKFRITGSTRRKFEIINFSFLFARGRYKR